VRAYLGDEQNKGDMLFADAWQKFTGRDIRGDFFFENRLRYLYGTYLQTLNFELQTNYFEYFECYTLSVSTEQSRYLFDQWFPWERSDYADMIDYIKAVDTQYAYAKQWFGFDDAAPIPTRILFDKIEGHAIAVRAEYVSLPGGNSLAAVHEATHHLLYAGNIYADFFWLTEGISEAIQFIYAEEDNNFYGPEMLTAFAKGNVNAFINEISSLYKSLTGKEYVFNGTFDFKQYTHIKALDAVNYFIENDIYGVYSQSFGNMNGKAEEKPSAFPQGLLNTYETAASFVLFMLEIGSKEDFMRFYPDTSAAEEVYGKDFNALYEQWLEFLRQL
jgi:hypothetical protein